MKVYTRVFNSALGYVEQVVTEVDVQFRSAVATIADLPTSDNVAYDARLALDNDHLYVYVDGEWVDQGLYEVSDLLKERLMQELS